MKFSYSSCFGHFQLHMNTEDRSLQPWDASDEFLLHWIKAEHPSAEKILVVNDRCGALAVPLGRRAGTLVNDSLCEREDTLGNLEENGRPSPLILSTLDELPEEPDLIVMHIPKSLDYFQFQLDALGGRIQNSVPIAAAGMSRYLPASFFACFEDLTENSSYSRIVKKARHYTGLLTPKLPGPGESALSGVPKSFFWAGREYLSLPGTFSLSRLDRGSRFLLENIPDLDGLSEAPRILDPGCGSGVLGLESLIKWPGAVLTATDENALAITCTRLNARNLGLEERCKVKHTRILKGIPRGEADLVICNPPFHRGHTVSVETGFAFIAESAGSLKKGGYFLAVVNRTLGYGKVLKKHYSSTRIVKQNRDFSLLLCRK